MTGIGLTAAEAIWWKAMTQYMTSYTSYTGARNATVLAAGQLYGNLSTERARTIQAWNLVGVVGIGTITTAAGTGTSGSSGDNGLATSATLSSPMGVAAAPDGSLFIADTGNNKVRRVDVAGVITMVAGTGTAGATDVTDGSGHIIATLSQLDAPYDVAISCTSYTCDTFDLYIADTNNHRVRSVDQNGYMRARVGTGTAGYNGNPNASQAQLYHPRGITLDPIDPDILYVADTSNHRVHRVDIGQDDITTLAGTGTSGFSGDGGAATSAKLDNPRGVVASASGDIYIADSYNYRVRKINGSGVISTVVGTGSAGSSGNGGAGTSATLNKPSHLAYYADYNATGIADENLFIADQYSNQVRRYSLIDNKIYAFAGTGTAGYSGDGGLAAQATLNWPFGVGVDLYGNVYIAQTLSHVVRAVAK